MWWRLQCRRQRLTRVNESAILEARRRTLKPSVLGSVHTLPTYHPWSLLTFLAGGLARLPAGGARFFLTPGSFTSGASGARGFGGARPVADGSSKGLGFTPLAGGGSASGVALAKGVTCAVSGAAPASETLRGTGAA